jgi:hypothetical protein
MTLKSRIIVYNGKTKEDAFMPCISGVLVGKASQVSVLGEHWTEYVVIADAKVCRQLTEEHNRWLKSGLKTSEVKVVPFVCWWVCICIQFV